LKVEREREREREGGREGGRGGVEREARGRRELKLTMVVLSYKHYNCLPIGETLLTSTIVAVCCQWGKS